MEDFGFSILFVGKPDDLYLLTQLMKGDMRLIPRTSFGDALREYAALDPDCVLMDLDTPASLAMVRQFANLGAAVVTLTSQTNEKALLAAIEHGAQENLMRNQLDSKNLVLSLKTVSERHRLTTIAHRATEALQESEARFRDIADRISQGLWVRNNDDRKCIYLNKAFINIWGRDLDDMNKMAWADTVHPDDREKATKFYLERRNTSADCIQSYRIVRPDGGVRWVENHAYPVMDETGKIVRSAGIVRDITHQRQLEEELRIAQKMESLGQLSAGIAHEINTPSQYVSDNITFLSDAIGDIRSVWEKLQSLLPEAEQSLGGNVALQELKDAIKKADMEYLMSEIPVALGQSKSGIEHIKKIVQAMKGFAHPGEEMVMTDIHDVIANTVIVAKNEWKYVATLENRFSRDVSQVLCVPSAISQVLLNIIVNAAHAIKDKFGTSQQGRIIISTRLDDDHVTINICDNGPGIPESIRQKIFDPFFTTKEVGKGTGQGLAIAHKIIREEHKGKILVGTSTEGGADFSILLPRKAEARAA